MASKFNFEEQREQSRIKTEIVIKYFMAWASILQRRFKRIGYIDLFAGPGIYENGIKSTPIILLEKIIDDSTLCSKVVTLFNEKEIELCNKLKTNIGALNNVNKLRYKPTIWNIEVTQDTAQKFKNKNMIPCFSFIDPAGYAGLSIDLIESLGKDYGSDLLFFFNYNDINRGMSNPKVEEQMKAIFGDENYYKLKKKIELYPDAREAIIINEMAQTIKNHGVQYVLPFRFKCENKNRTSHYLIFASKNFTGYKIMKDIMHNAGEKDSDGVGRFEFIPSCDKTKGIQLSIIDLYNSSLDELKKHIKFKYKGKKVYLKNLYENDAVENRYVLKDYRRVILEMEQTGEVICDPPHTQRRKNTLAESKVLIHIK